jgi:hypothetical protein
MKLTGKCKEDFENWYNTKTFDKGGDLPPLIFDYDWKFAWNHLTESMKYGVYVDFAEKYADDNNLVNHILKLQRIYYVDMNCGLEESRLESVSKFNLIYNSQNET